MPINKSNIKPFACRVTRNGTRNKSTSNLARKGFKLLPLALLFGIISANMAFAAEPVPSSTSVFFAVDNSDVTMTITIPSEDLTMTTNSVSTTSGAVFTNKVIPVTVGTNSPTGYTLTMKARNASETNLARTEAINNTTYTIDALPTKSGGYTLSEFSSVSDSATMNKWGWSSSGTDSNNYFPLTTTGDTIATASGQGTTTTSVTMGVKIDNNTPAGIYGTTIVFVATTEPYPSCNQNEICYKGNGSDGGTFMAHQTAGYAGTDGTSVAAGNTITLWASNYKRSGYGFAGWSTEQLDPDSASFSTNLATAVSAGKVYGPNQDITMPSAVASDGLTLYAVWVKSAGNMQGWTCPNNANMPIGTITALKDTRDNNVYAVAKLADGKCWMVENLRLGNYKTDTVSPVESFTALNTNNPIISSLGQNNSGAWCDDANTGCINQSKFNTLNTTNTIANMTNPTTGISGIYSYGNYYNWYSATAGSGTYESAANSNQDSSICPNNWKLPSGGAMGTNNDYYNLVYKMMNNIGPNNDNYYDSTSNAPGYPDATASKKTRMYPNNFVFSGMIWGGGSWAATGSTLSYWSSTADSLIYPYAFGGNNSGVIQPGTGLNAKFHGASVRCVTGS